MHKIPYYYALSLLFFGLNFPPAISKSCSISKQQHLTPLEASGFTQLTLHSDLLAYLAWLDSLSTRVTLERIGQSVEGRAIPLVLMSEDKIFGNRRSEKPIVLIFAQQHGNEPSGKEAALILIRELAVGSLQGLLQNLDLMIIPQVNPDGADRNQRRNANDMDLNRNHLILSEPEIMALHDLFLKWLPEVTLDVHEYTASSKDWICNGYIKDAEEMLDCVSNLNIDTRILDFSENVILLRVEEFVEKDGFSFHRYLVGGPPELKRMRHSTTHINDGRQSLGIYNTFSFILEGKRFADVISHIERRTNAQFAAMRAFLNTVVLHKHQILQITHSARRQLVQPNRNELIHLRMDYNPDPERSIVTLPIFDLYSWQQMEKELKNYEPLVKVKKSVKKPVAYIFSEQETRLTELLARHQIDMYRLKKDCKLEVEKYTIVDTSIVIEEDYSDIEVTVNAELTLHAFKKGSIVVFLQQKAANLIPLMLEPQSSYSICTESSGQKYRFSEFMQPGTEYPIYRLMKLVELDTEALEK